MVRKRSTDPVTADLFVAEPGPAPEMDAPWGPLEPVEPLYLNRPKTLVTSAADIPNRDFEWASGVHLVGSVLWCDAQHRADLSFLSHAHIELPGKNQRVLATAETIRLLSRGVGRADALQSPYYQSFQLGTLTLELRPAGHVLGSAQLLVVKDGKKLVYCSDINPRSQLTGPAAEPISCDVLALPATYGRPNFRFPPREEVFAELRAFVQDTLDAKATPVLVVNPLGTAQELLAYFARGGFKVRAAKQIVEVAKIYQELGVAQGKVRRFSGVAGKDEVVLVPPILREHPSVRGLKKFATGLISGRVLEPGWVARHRVERGFVLSDSADAHDLFDFVKATGAGEVYLSGGHVDEFGERLRGEGIRVHGLMKPRQLSLFG